MGKRVKFKDGIANPDVYDEILSDTVDAVLRYMQCESVVTPGTVLLVEAKTGQSAYDKKAVDEAHEWDMEWERQTLVVLLRAAERHTLAHIV